MEKESESLTQSRYKIVVDTVTGVNYLESPREESHLCLMKLGKFASIKLVSK
nr:DUF6440 family protein [Enterococcus faecalis]